MLREFHVYHFFVGSAWEGNGWMMVNISSDYVSCLLLLHHSSSDDFVVRRQSSTRMDGWMRQMSICPSG